MPRIKAYNPQAKRIPNELLVLVFLAAIPHIRSSIDIKSLSRTQAPLNISHVCRHWRNIALSTPQLWTQVHFDIRTYELQSEAEVAAAALPVIIPRSAHCPLDLKVVLSPGSDGEPCFDLPTEGDWSTLASTVLRAVIPAQQRWRLAMVVAPRELWQEGFDDGSEWRISDARDAQELRIGTPYAYFEGIPRLRRHMDDQFMLEISCATKLERLTISFYDGTINADNVFPRLRSFHVKRTSEEVPLPVIFQILQSSPALEEVCWPMSAHSKSRISKDGLPRIRLENLHTLALRYECTPGSKRLDDIGKLRYVLDRLTLPQLCKFHLDADNYGGVDTKLVAVRNFLLRSAPPLISLTLKEIEGVQGYDEQLINCLTSVPQLEELALELHVSNYRIFFERLTIYSPGSSGHPNICTMLTSLTIHGAWLGDTLDDWLDAAVQMALSRSPADSDRYTDDDSETPLGRYGTSVLSKVILKVDRSYEELQKALHHTGLLQLVARGLVWEMGEYVPFDSRCMVALARVFYASDDDDSCWDE